MKEIKVYPQRILRLLTQAGFISRFYEFIKQEKTYAEAYWRVEREHLYYFGFTKYSGYGSFRKVREKHNSKKGN